jgi:hypothetical protein
MVAQTYTEMNTEIFGESFIGGERNFTEWLNRHLDTGECYPFLITPPGVWCPYELDDLLRDLTQDPKAGSCAKRIIGKAVQDLLKEKSPLDLQALYTLRTAANAADVLPPVKGALTRKINVLELEAE